MRADWFSAGPLAGRFFGLMAGGGGCEERFAVSAIVEPARLGELCPDQPSLNATTGTVTLALDVDVHVE